FLVSFEVDLVELGESAEVEVIGVETFGRLAAGARDLGEAEARLDCADDVRCDLVLKLENIIESAVESVGPDMRAGRGIDQLACNSHPIRGLPHASFEHVTHAQLARRLSHVDRLPLISQASLPRDEEKPGQ